MPIDPISWIFIGYYIAELSVIILTFWEDIKAWLNKVYRYILKTINQAIEVVAGGLAYLIEESHRVYKRLEVWVRNVVTGSTRLVYQQEEVSPLDIPVEIRAELDEKAKIKLQMIRSESI